MNRFLLPLGINGFYPSHGRQTMTSLLADGERRLLIDAGSGIARLAEPEVAATLEGVEVLDVVLSHYHLDYVLGLPTLSAVWDRPLRLHAPADGLVDGGPEILDRLVAPPLFPCRLPQFPFPIEILPYGGERLTAGGFEIRLRRQRHPGGSVGMRFGDGLAFCTDTIADPETARFTAGVATLVHEVWLDGADAVLDDPTEFGHSTAAAAAGIATEAGAGRLVPVHCHPRYPDERWQAIAGELAGHGAPPVILPREGHALELPGDELP